MRLIDADSLSEKIREECHKCYVPPYDIGRMIAEQPTVPAFGKWNKLTIRELTEEEEKDYPDCTFLIEGLPSYDEIVLATDGKHVWTDCFHIDDVVYLDSGDEIENVIAWMPLPEPPQESLAHKEEKQK